MRAYSMIILTMGVTAAGKTTVGRALAEQLHWRFADADDYHSPANVAKMRAGIPLTDEDRAPWLQSLSSAIREWIAGRRKRRTCLFGVESIVSRYSHRQP